MSIFTVSGPQNPEQLRTYVEGLLGLLGERDPLEVQRRTPEAVRAALEGFSASEAVRPEAPGKWSARHVVQHLADAELVNGFRLRLILAHDRPPLTPYDQERFAEKLRYAEASPTDGLEQFAALRRANLRLWQGLSPVELERVGLHGERGEESLGLMRRTIAGHDLLHLRQLARIREAITAGRQ